MGPGEDEDLTERYRLGRRKLRYVETVRDGLDDTLDAFLALMRGENVGYVGKVIVNL
ncbi:MULTISPECIES: hypothetical protein [unclassified Streptomyces]|uniref:hypothetical protein n=1 Tax=unclassified Streptomyces TaxID=2593676 RepID=UPI00225A733C|nr:MULTISPECIES: hypothetical protein [unclassified Streptomyces]MCX5286530.1 hypothetical protein [Streptomyces sp. NBC_00183]